MIYGGVFAMNQEVSKKIISVVASFSLLLGSSVISSSFLSLKNKKDVDKPYEYVLRDFENFNVDTGVADAFFYWDSNAKNIRLDFNNGKVIVDCKGYMEDREKRIISKVVDYYNKVFATIDESYGFELRDYDKTKDKDKSVIYISNSDLLKNIEGLYIPNEFETTLEDGVFVDESRILLNWDKIKDTDDLYVCYVILHEFGHALGFGDLFYDERNIVDYVDMTTVMQIDNFVVPALYPNDYAVLQALYSREYKNHDNYDDAVKVVNDKIERYTRAFYEHYANEMKESMIYDVCDSWKQEDFGDNIVFQGAQHYNYNCFYSLKIDENNRCKLKIMDKNKGFICEGEGEVIFANGVLFVKRIDIKHASDYSAKYSEDLGLKLMLCLYQDARGNIFVKDGTYQVMGIKIADYAKQNSM